MPDWGIDWPPPLRSNIQEALLNLLRACLDAQACGDGLPQSVDKATLAAEAALTASEAPAKRWEALLARARA